MSPGTHGIDGAETAADMSGFVTHVGFKRKLGVSIAPKSFGVGIYKYWIREVSDFAPLDI
jgi:hypothetical protein